MNFRYKNRPPKDEALIKHTIKRFKERFNVDVDEDYVLHLGKRIRNLKECESLYKQSNTRSIYLVRKENENDIMNIDYIAVYNKDKHKVCTVFPVEYLDEWECDEEIGEDAF